MRRAATLGAGPDASAKLARLAQLLEEYSANGRKVLIFSYFLDVLDAVAERFDVRHRISGSVSAEERLRICDEFQAVDGHACLVAQIQAGGVGLNLQGASVVVLLEPQWKPSTEEQAIARAHRMGQVQAVVAHRFYAADSVDERMHEVLEGKRELFDTFARGSALKDASGEATEAELARVVIEAEVQRLGLEAESTEDEAPERENGAAKSEPADCEVTDEEDVDEAPSALPKDAEEALESLLGEFQSDFDDARS